MLSAILKAGFAITGTWPLHTERETGLKASVNALASSIVLVCRKRPQDAPSCTRNAFLTELSRELRTALHKLQESTIAPVDLAQAAIGPGMAVFSRYASVLKADGSPLTVREALQYINQELDAFLTEQEGELDEDSRFCLSLYAQCAFNEMKFGEADVLANAKNTSVAELASKGLVSAKKGFVGLIPRENLPELNAQSGKCLWLLTQQLTHTLDKGGVEKCANILVNLASSAPERAKNLAYRLYTLAEQKGWTQEAYAYNALVSSWSEIQRAANSRGASQGSLL